jgi:hypothetical protein
MLVGSTSSNRCVGFPLLALLLLPAVGEAQEWTHAVRSITEAELRDHVFYLASDFLEGRETATRGYELAAQYTAVHLEQAGLQPLYTDSTGVPSYFQRIQFVSSAVSPESGLGVTVGGVVNALGFGEEFVVQEIFATGADRSVEESPVFLGFGIQEPDLGWDDYAGLDVAGKIGVIVVGVPTRDGEAVLPEEQHQFYSSFQQSASARFRAALDHGITTLIVVPDSGAAAIWEAISRRAGTPSTRALVKGAEEGGPAPAMSELILLKPEAAVQLLSGTGLDPMTRTGTYAPGLLEGVQISLEMRHDVEPGYSSPNVVGLLPGSDAVLKDEHIVVTAHLDHVGIQNGVVFNGADDNASGSAAVLEAAEAAAMMSVGRSVIFLLLTAEEKGMQGSTTFAANPPVPIESIVLNINLDMVGRNSPDFPDVLLALASENGRPQLLDLIREVNDAGVRAPLDWRLNEGEDPHAHVERSDQMAFMQRGIPAILITRGFMGPDYHEATDDPETINYAKILHAARLTFALTVEAANREDLGLRPSR